MLGLYLNGEKKKHSLFEEGFSEEDDDIEGLVEIQEEGEDDQEDPEDLEDDLVEGAEELEKGVTSHDKEFGEEVLESESDPLDAGSKLSAPMPDEANYTRHENHRRSTLPESYGTNDVIFGLLLTTYAAS